MPLLAGFLTAVFTKIFEFLGQFMAKRVALAGAAIAIFITALVAVWAILQGLIAGLAWAWPAPSGPWVWFYVGLGRLFPNLDFYIATVIAGDTAVFLYRWNHENVFKVPLYIT